MQCLKPSPDARYTGIFDALFKIVKNEGAFRPVRGMGVVAFGAGPAHALYFSCYEFIKNNCSGPYHKPGDNTKINLIAGGFATILHDLVMVPSDVIKQRLQMYNSPYKGLFDCVIKIKRSEGIKAFYRSYFTQLSMNIPFQCTHLVTYDFLQSILNSKREYNPLSHCISGALAGALAAAITTPLDVCKTVINTQECCNPEILCKSSPIKSFEKSPNSTVSSSNQINQTKMMNIITNQSFVRSQSTTSVSTVNGFKDAARIIYRIEGFKGFFKGVMPRTIFQIPGTAVSWSVYEYFKHSLKEKD
jgi:solute carrier family 25 iron transporter 28/37